MEIGNVAQHLLETVFKDAIIKVCSTQRCVQVEISREQHLPTFSPADCNRVCDLLKEKLVGLGYDVDKEAMNIFGTKQRFEILF